MSKQSEATLDPMEIQQLLNVYNSELRQLSYRILSVQKNIEQLEVALSEVSTISPAEIVAVPDIKAAPVAVPPAVVSQPAAAKPELDKPAVSATTNKARTKAKAPRKVNMPKPATVQRKRKLSPWDHFILDALATSNRTMIMSEFLEKVKNEFEPAKGWTEAKIKSKLNAVFHKLANKKGSIVKVSFEGRGFAYALPNWLNNAGELKKKYRR